MSDDPYAALSPWDRSALELGQFILVWRDLELSVTWIALVLHKWGGGDALERKGPPRAFARKLKMIESCFQTHPKLADLIDVAGAAVVAWAVMAAERDFLVHAVEIKLFDDLPPVRMMVDRTQWPDPPEPPDIRGPMDMGLGELAAHTLDVLHFSRRLLSDVIKRVAPDHVNQALSERLG